MAVRTDTIFERFLAPIARLLVDREAIQHLHEAIDWEAAVQRFTNPQLVYPDYYREANFHSIEGGYRSINAAITYDPITHLALPPSEDWVRQSLLDRLPGQPRRILDLGCGTGSMTLRLKARFPAATVIGVDLSPYMLAVADYRAQQADQDIHWQQGNAEHTGLEAESFDLVTATLLFHETPSSVAQTILRECHRLLRPGGTVAILDGCQPTLRQTDWLMDLFEEPYIRDYANGDVAEWLAAAGFGAIATTNVWGLHQVTQGVRPLSATTPAPATADEPTQVQWATA